MKGITLRTLIALSVSGAIAGCSSSNTVSGGSDTNNTLPDTATLFGTMAIEDNEADFNLLLTAVFREMPPTSTAEITDSLARRNLSVDDCEVFIGDESLQTPSEFELAFESVPFISAGEVITISGPSGSIGELQRRETNFYRDTIETTEDISSDLVVDIPGADFPAVSEIKVPNVAPFRLTSNLVPSGPFNDEYDIASTFTWEPDSDPDSRVWFYSDVSGDLRIDIDCILQDDGSFTLPADVQSRLLDNGQTEIPMFIGREATIVHQQDETLTMVSRRSGPLD